MSNSDGRIHDVLVYGFRRPYFHMMCAQPSTALVNSPGWDRARVSMKDRMHVDRLLRERERIIFITHLFKPLQPKTAIIGYSDSSSHSQRSQRWAVQRHLIRDMVS